MTRGWLTLLPVAWGVAGCSQVHSDDKGSGDTGTGSAGWCDPDDPPDCDDVSLPCTPLDEAPLILNGCEPDQIGGYDHYDGLVVSWS